MLDYIKNKLLENPMKILELLESFGFYHIQLKGKYISFGRDDKSSTKGVTLYLESNEPLLIKDWSHNQCKDIFNYIISEKGVSFSSVINKTKLILNIDESSYIETENISVFGGFYASIKKKNVLENKIYDENILYKYDSRGNKMFLNDGISLIIQKDFEIGYSIQDSAVSIPIRDEFGNLIGVKMRANFNVTEGHQKYWYDVPCMMSQTLYNYSHSYQYLESADIIYIVEAEKGVMQASTIGYRNVVALGSGSISKKQCQLLLSLNCNKFVFLHDTGYQKEFVIKNMIALKTYARHKKVKVYYWDNFDKGYEDKLSATDMPDKFKYILENEIKEYDDE